MVLSSLIHRSIRMFYPYGAIRAVRRGPLRGMRFVVRPAMGFTFAWQLPANWEWFQQHLAPGMIVYDVGANRGQTALAFARAVGPTGRVVSFEPVSDLFCDLKHNIELNQLLWVTPIEAAVSDQTGHTSFVFDPLHSTQGKLSGCEPDYVTDHGQEISVRTVALDDCTKSDLPVPQLLKIDVEGGAKKVLKGAQYLLRHFRPSIYIELHGPEEQCAVRDLIQTNGYVTRRLNGDLVPDPTVHWVNPLWCEPSELS